MTYKLLPFSDAIPWWDAEQVAPVKQYGKEPLLFFCCRCLGWSRAERSWLKGVPPGINPSSRHQKKKKNDPGRAPFSQLSSGVKDAMVVCTKLLSLPLLVGQDADVSPFFALRGFLVAHCCLLWYWLGFYLRLQPLTTVSQSSLNIKICWDVTHNMLNANFHEVFSPGRAYSSQVYLFFLLLAAKVRSSCEEGPGQSALQSAYHNAKLDVTELKQNRTSKVQAKNCKKNKLTN